MKVIKIAVAGAQGRVGQCLTQALQTDAETQCVVSIVREPLENSSAITLSTLKTLYQSSHKPFDIDVLIDFSVCDATQAHLDFCALYGIPMVIGTTGLSELQKSKLLSIATQIPIIFAPNMSVGINLLYKLIEVAAQVLDHKAQAAILDIHHQYKKDQPSGTALKMQEIILNASQYFNQSKEANIQCPVASLRIGNSLGEHRILFSMDAEEVVLSHKTLDRMVYAKGAILAAKWLFQKSPGLYDMHDVLNLKETFTINKKKESYV